MLSHFHNDHTQRKLFLYEYKMRDRKREEENTNDSFFRLPVVNATECEHWTIQQQSQQKICTTHIYTRVHSHRFHRKTTNEADVYVCVAEQGHTAFDHFSSAQIAPDVVSIEF